MCQALLGGGSSVGPLPPEFKALSSGFVPDLIDLRLPPVVNAAGKTIVGSGLSLHMTTIVVGIVGVLAYAYVGANARRTRERHGYEAEPFTLFAVKTVVISLLALLLVYQFATYKGIPMVLVVMGSLIGLFIFVTKRMTIGRRVYAIGGNAKAAQLSGINTGAGPRCWCSSTWACSRRSAA